MTDVDDNLVTALGSTGAGIYFLKKPLEAELPAIVITRVSEQSFIAHSTDRLLNLTRFQIVCMAATYALMRTLVKAVETALIANTTNFVLSLPLGGPSNLPDSKDDDNVRASMRDYYVWSTPS